VGVFSFFKSRVTWLHGFVKTIIWKNLHLLRIQGPPKLFWYFYRLARPVHKELIVKNSVHGSSNFSRKLHNEIEPIHRTYLSIPEKVFYQNREVEYDFAWAISNSIPRAEHVTYVRNIVDEGASEKMIREASNACRSGEKSLLILWGIPLGQESSTVRKLHELHKLGERSRSIVFLGDVRKTRGLGQIVDYVDKVDLVIHFNPLVLKNELGSFAGKTMIWPGIPYPEDKMEVLRFRQKRPVLSISGQSYRYRSIYINYCEKRGIPILDTSSRGATYPISSFWKYLDFVSSAQIMFANGYLYPRESILVGKVIEAILTGTTVLYESGSWINRFLVPFEHFIPVYNKFDLIEKAQYLLENPEVAETIARNAYSFYTTHYSSRDFWSKVQKKLA